MLETKLHPCRRIVSNHAGNKPSPNLPDNTPITLQSCWNAYPITRIQPCPDSPDNTSTMPEQVPQWGWNGLYVKNRPVSCIAGIFPRKTPNGVPVILQSCWNAYPKLPRRPLHPYEKTPPCSPNRTNHSSNKTGMRCFKKGNHSSKTGWRLRT